MANIRLHDVMASVEAWLIDNWPAGTAKFVPGAADVRRPFDSTIAAVQVSAQWLTFDPVPQRPGNDWNTVDLRLVVQATDNDRLKAAEVVDALRDLIRTDPPTAVEVLDRADESTNRGWVVFDEVGITPPQRDARGVVVAVVDAVGRAHSA